ncbi:MAG: UDP-3-O-(3-hydroxymyristoyl)glucosamine N-acyltransferase [Bacteroidetes bacterium]|nr:MAG: UDP-3-O-(3-hydroxymyristoyl)glucosamine N-acyltransferase [Bacteroidota bacterium]
MQITAKEIAQILDGILEGDAEAIITHPGKIEEGGAGALTFLANPKYEPFAYTHASAALLVPADFVPAQPVAARALIRVGDVYGAVAKLLSYFDEGSDFKPSISGQAAIAETAQLGKEVSVGEFAVIEKGARIGDGVCIYPQVYIGENVEIGAGTILYPGVRILKNCSIGARCILHANVVIGSDGFGFAPNAAGQFSKIPQIGRVRIEDDVEIGANTTIDRATMGETIVRRGTKIDNLVMVAHNVEIGEDTVIAAQTGFAGSAKIGNHCRIGGQAGFVGHIKVADHSQVQAQSGVAASIKQEHSAVYGSPAIPYGDYLRAYAVFKKLPELYKKINDLEKQLKGSGKP